MLCRMQHVGSVSNGYAAITERAELWLQLGPDVNEKELLAAFRRYGRVTGHSMIRKSNCAFVDFESAAAATEAKQALNGARFSSCQIRLEYKVSSGPPLKTHDIHHHYMGYSET